MNPRTLAAAVLISLGVVVLAYSGLSFTTPGETVSFLGLHVQTTDSHFIPPVAGAGPPAKRIATRLKTVLGAC